MGYIVYNLKKKSTAVCNTVYVSVRLKKDLCVCIHLNDLIRKGWSVRCIGKRVWQKLNDDYIEKKGMCCGRFVKTLECSHKSTTHEQVFFRWDDHVMTQMCGEKRKHHDKRREYKFI